MLKHALLACLVLLPLATSEALATNAGVTAAVNQNAKSTPPGGGVRTVVLGANVVQDEKIETDGAGLVQILLADGTTFTVGPNSSLVIDRFVYDPNANTAQVAATLGRGVFRFIGGRTSKSEGGVQLNTPVGTVGIRGGMADLNFSGTGGTIAQIDLLFGNEVTLSGPNGGDRIYQAGYSIIIGPNGQPTVVKTPPGSANIIQQALAGRPGSTGGSKNSPSDGDVANSGVPGSNSNNNPPPTDIPPPDLTAIDLATPKPNETHQTAENLGGQIKTKRGFSAGLFNTSLPAGYVAAPLSDIEGESLFLFNKAGKLAAAKFVVGLQEVGDEDVSFENGTATVLTGNYPGAENFTADIESQPSYSNNDVYTVVTRSGERLSDCECLDIDWGYWSSSFEAPVLNGAPQDVQLLGTWVAGDTMTQSQYDSFALQYGSANAFYAGDVRGYGQYGGPDIVAGPMKEGRGTFDMQWNFGTDSGSFSVFDFTTEDSVDFNHSFSASTDISRDDMTAYFKSVPNTDTGAAYLGVSGAFINNGSEAAAGVIGNFSGLDTFAYGEGETSGVFSASGIFAGEPTYPH